MAKQAAGSSFNWLKGDIFGLSVVLQAEDNKAVLIGVVQKRLEPQQGVDRVTWVKLSLNALNAES